MTNAEREAWEACITRGDEAEIEAMKRTLLTGIFTKIMNEDVQYQLAGWKP